MGVFALRTLLFRTDNSLSLRRRKELSQSASQVDKSQGEERSMLVRKKVGTCMINDPKTLSSSSDTYEDISLCMQTRKWLI